jgi:hypothetical protein
MAPTFGPTTATPVLPQDRDIAGGRGVLPHPHIHGRRDQDRQRGGEQHRRGEVVGMAVRHLGDEVGGRRRDDHQIGVAREPDMADIGLVLAVEQVGVGPRARNAAAAIGVMKCCAPRGQDAAHARAPRSRRRRMRSSDL